MRRDLLLAAIGARYCESNAIAVALDGQMIGIGAGQPSRIAATEIACNRADTWKLRQHLTEQPLPTVNDAKRNDIDQAATAYAQQSLRQPGSIFTHPALIQDVPCLDAEAVAGILTTFQQRASIWSDGFIPFPDNIQTAAAHGVGYLGQPGGSIQDPRVKSAADHLGLVMLTVGERFFYH